RNPFYISTETRPWLTNGDGQKRRAGVSAFGFGGTNFHAVLEEYVPPVETELASNDTPWPAELFVWKARSLEQLVKQVSQTESAVNALVTQDSSMAPGSLQEKKRLLELASRLQLKTSADSDATAILAIVAASLADL